MGLKNIITLVGLVCLLPACIKYSDLAKSEFPQGTKQADQRMVAQKYRRGAKIYDDFETRAFFHALWLSDELRKSYVDVYSKKRGLSEEAKEEMLKRQLEENKYWITFYVLADVRDKTYEALNDRNAHWTAYVTIDDKKITPEKDGIKPVDLEPEYQLFFGKAIFDLFKAGYLVRFSVQQDLSEKINKGQFKNIKLVIGSVYKECALAWTAEELGSKKKVTHDEEDFYWG